MKRFTLIAIIIIAAGVFYFNKKSAKPAPVKPVVASRIKTPAPVEASPEKVVETQPAVEEGIAPIESIPSEETFVAKPEKVLPENVPEPTVAIETPIPAEIPEKVVLAAPKDDEERLSTEDKIEDLQENVRLLRNELNELYKEKVMVGYYSSSDKIQNLTEDAIEYLKDPVKYSEKTSSEMVINTKQFLENVKQLRLKASKPR